jgi:hypothetical protein
MGESRAGKTKVRISTSTSAIDGLNCFILHVQLINLLSRSNFPVGKGHRSCTNHIQLSRVFEYEDQKLMFIDTPGLEHSARGESDLLNEIACFLADV